MNALKSKAAELQRVGKFLVQTMRMFQVVFPMPEAEWKRAGGKICHDGKVMFQSPELRAIAEILRACIRGEHSKSLKEQLGVLADAASKHVDIVYRYEASAGRGCVKQFGPIGRVAVQALEHYTGLLTSDPRLVPHEPIGICPHCQSLFLKARCSQEYCSAKCQVARWGTGKGNEYFAAKQRERRAKAKEKAEAAKKRTRRRRPIAEKSGGILTKKHQKTPKITKRPKTRKAATGAASGVVSMA